MDIDSRAKSRMQKGTFRPTKFTIDDASGQIADSYYWIASRITEPDYNTKFLKKGILAQLRVTYDMILELEREHGKTT